MKRTLKIKSIVSDNQVVAMDSVGRSYTISTDRVLAVGQSVLTVSGVVVALVKSKVEKVYEV